MFVFQMQTSEGMLPLQEEAPFPRPSPLAVPALPEPMMAAHRGNGTTSSRGPNQQRLPPLHPPPPSPGSVHAHDILLPHTASLAVRHHQLHSRVQHNDHILPLSIT